MKIKEMYRDIKDIDIYSYMAKCGVEDIEQYISASYLEPLDNYDNIYECAKGLSDNDDTLYILVDTDCDGFMSSSMAYIYFKKLKPNMEIIPIFHYDNKSKAHGLKDNKVMSYLTSVKPSVLFIPDASTNDNTYCEKLYNLGWKIFISDHHKKSTDNPYAIIVNNQISDKVQNKALSGCGVTWKVLSKIDKINNTDYANDLISYVWIANIGDSMNFNTSENHTFRFWGSLNIHDNLKPFIIEFNRNEDVENKACYFGLISKINALIRVGSLEEKELLFKILCGEEKSDDLFKIMKSLHSRQNNLKDKLLKDIDIITDNNVVLAKIKEKTTLTGLIANKLMGIYNKPILLLHDKEDGEVAGSMRTKIPITKELNQSGLFNYIEGHDFACGVSYQKENEDKVIDYLNNILALPEPYIDVLISSTTKTIPISLFSLYNDNLMLFGKGLEVPKYHFKPFTINSLSIKELGANKTTLKFSKDGIDFIIFFANEKLKNDLCMDKSENTELLIECVCELSVNTYKCKKTLQAEIINIEVKQNKRITANDIFKKKG